MKKLYLLLLFFITTFSLFAQRIEIIDYNKSVIKYDTVLELKPIEFIVSHWSDEIVYSSYNNNLMVVDFNSKVATNLGFFKINLNNYKVSYYDIMIPEIFSTKKIWQNASLYLSNIAFNDKYVVFQYDKLLYVLEYGNNFKLTFLSTIKLPEIYINYIKFLKDDILLVGQNYDLDGSKSFSVLTTYDVTNGKKIKSTKPYFSLGEITHFYPNHYIDATSNNILFAEAADYVIDVYDENLSPVSNLKYEKEDWVKISDRIIGRLDNGLTMKSRVKTLRKYYNEFDKILTSNFINDSLLIVKYSDADPTKVKPETENIGWDVWKYTNIDQQWTMLLNDDFKTFYKYVASKHRTITSNSKFRNFGFVNNKVIEFRYYPSAFEWKSREYFEKKGKEKKSEIFEYKIESDSTQINSDDNSNYDINKNGGLVKLYIYNLNLED